jgi:hypothetical protein
VGTVQLHQDEQHRYLLELGQAQGKLWSHIDAVLAGRVKRVQGNAPFKIPRSQYPFIHMGKIPEDILEQFFRNVVAGLWSLKAFTDECKRYKATMATRKLIIEYLVTKTWMPPRSSWDECTNLFPKMDDEWVDQWVLSVMMMPVLKQHLPENAKDAIVQLHRGLTSNRRTQVPFPF